VTPIDRSRSLSYELDLLINETEGSGLEISWPERLWNDFDNRGGDPPWGNWNNWNQFHNFRNR
jgi:hypothetical protein